MNKNLLKSKFVAHGLTYDDVAGRMGISKNTLSNKVNGVTYFDTEEITRLCEILNIEEDSEKVEIFLR